MPTLQAGLVTAAVAKQKKSGYSETSARTFFIAL